MKRGKRERLSQNVSGGGEGPHWPSLKLEEGQSIVLGVKTGTAVCCSQA